MHSSKGSLINNRKPSWGTDQFYRLSRSIQKTWMFMKKPLLVLFLILVLIGTSSHYQLDMTDASASNAGNHRQIGAMSVDDTSITYLPFISNGRGANQLR